MKAGGCPQEVLNHGTEFANTISTSKLENKISTNLNQNFYNQQSYLIIKTSNFNFLNGTFYVE